MTDQAELRIEVELPEDEEEGTVPELIVHAPPGRAFLGEDRLWAVIVELDSPLILLGSRDAETVYFDSPFTDPRASVDHLVEHIDRFLESPAQEF